MDGGKNENFYETCAVYRGSNFKKLLKLRLSLIVRANVVLNRTVVDDSD